MQSVQRSDDVLSDEQMANEVALVFVSPEHGILMQEYQSLDAAGGVCVFVFLCTRERVCGYAQLA